MSEHGIVMSEHGMKTMVYIEPESSNWKCYLFGATRDGGGIEWKPEKGQVPNWFVRLIMRVCFACRWEKQ